MSHPRKSSSTLALVLFLALVTIAGLIGMLLADGTWDWIFLFCSASPLLVGGWRWAAKRSG